MGVERDRVLCRGLPGSDQGLTHARESVREALSESLRMAGGVRLCYLLSQHFALTGERTEGSERIVMMV